MSSASDAGPAIAELFPALPVAVLVVDPAGTIRHANAAAETLLNLSERAMNGQPLDRLIRLRVGETSRRGHGLAAFDAEALVRGVPMRLDYIETQATDHPGWRIVTLHHAPTGSRRTPGGTGGAGARAAMGAAAMLAHEIKNPLSGIRGAAQLLGGDLDGEQRELARLITTEVDRIAALIDVMQDFTDTRPLALVPLNIHALLDHARRVAQAGFAAGITIEERFDPSLPPVLLDRDAFVQTMLNLLKNAAEALAETVAPRIIITTAYRHGLSVRTMPDQPRRPLPIELLVIDNGPGAPPEIVDHLFEPFISGRPEGRGLGLSLVAKLVRDMGGIVEYSRQGDPEQTVFRLLLPRADR